MIEEAHDDEEPIWNLDDDAQLRRAFERHPLIKERSYGSLLRAVADEAKKSDQGDRYWRFNQGAEVVETILRAVNEDGWKLLDEEERGSKKGFWYHKQHIRLAGKRRLEPYIIAQDTQEAAATYLRLPYRVPALDRLLLDMLIASEMFGFADEVQPILKRKLPLILGWLLNNVVSVAAGLAIAAFVLWIGNDNTIMNWIGGIILVLTLLGTAWSLIAFPFFYPKLRAQHKKVENAISGMRGAYVTLGGTPASTKHIDEMLAKATDKGAVWPSQLIVLMEDIRARTTTI
ncbi:hypothetical protein ACX40Y_09575 [Sphingomonas sp. RS6]